MAHEEADTAATEVLRRNLSSADHMALLHAQWEGETRPLTIARYERLVRAALGPQHADTELSHKTIWLWRTLRVAETAGHNAGQLVRQAVEEWPLDDAEDIAAVLDHRIRTRTAGQIPQPAESWSQRVPHTADPEHQRYLHELAAAMDDRTERIGEHLAARPPAWAILAFGLVPTDPVDRLEWERRAGRAGVYRELYGYEHPSDPIGSEPSAATPEKRALWHAAFRQLRPAEGVDLRGKDDGTLLHMRGTYATVTAYAPRYVARQLRETRLGVREQSQIASTAKAEAWFADIQGDTQRQTRQEEIARQAYDKAAWFRARESEYAVADAVHREYMDKTAPERRLAVAADAEYRNRHPAEKLEPLRSAEPEPVTDEERDAFWPNERNPERDSGRPNAERQEATEPHWAKDLADRLAARQAQKEAAAAADPDPATDRADQDRDAGHEEPEPAGSRAGSRNWPSATPEPRRSSQSAKRSKSRPMTRKPKAWGWHGLTCWTASATRCCTRPKLTCGPRPGCWPQRTGLPGARPRRPTRRPVDSLPVRAHTGHNGGRWLMADVSFFAHVPGGYCPHCRALGIDFGEDDPGADEETTSYPLAASGTITSGHLSDFDPWASRAQPHDEE